MNSSLLDPFRRRVVIVIGGSTLVLTAVFVGVLAVISGELAGVSGRAPWYVVTAAAVFVASVVLLDADDAAGTTIIVSAAVVSAFAFVTVALAVEGFRFAVIYPGRVFVSQLVLYFLAAALIGTGLGYWALNHWREFSTA
ncbi:hypothetical protein [Haloarcula salinisoli]|uniref:hypothetical protein n=1 Tax=Haloarcula salinisoli TaxID=2487746 RepID=UPI001F1A884A|nr:hypothetical protein [Halomicroarcula salinisoli]